MYQEEKRRREGKGREEKGRRGDENGNEKQRKVIGELDMERDGESGSFDKLQSYMGEAFHGQILYSLIHYTFVVDETIEISRGPSTPVQEPKVGVLLFPTKTLVGGFFFFIFC